MRACALAGAFLVALAFVLGAGGGASRTVATGPLVVVSLSSGIVEPVRPMLSSDDYVEAIVRDGSGGWFVGGAFPDRPNGFATCGIMHVHATGTRDETCFAKVGGPRQEPGVSSLLRRGHVLYAGGHFARFNGSSRWSLAAVDERTGALLPWAPRVAACLPAKKRVPTNVGSLTLRGRTIYFSGGICDVSGHSRTDLAAVDAISGNVASWDPRTNAELIKGSIYSVTASAHYVFLLGSFTRVSGAAHDGFAALDPRTGKARRFPQLRIGSIVVRSTTLYTGGAPFGVFAGAAAFAEATGKRLPWKPAAPRNSQVLSATTRSVFLAVPVDSKGVGQSCNPVCDRLTMVDARTGAALLSRSPVFDGEIGEAVEQGAIVVVGGFFEHASAP